MLLTNRLQLLLDNEDNYVKLATLEKCARKACNEILADGKFSVETFDVVTHFPPKDYKLFHKRVNELVTLFQSVQIQDEKISGETPGL